MGKTKTKFIDDSQTQEKGKKQKAQPKADLSVETTEAVMEKENVIQGNEVTTESKDVDKKPQKIGKSKPRSKKYQEKLTETELDKQQSYPVNQVLELVKALSYSKFPGTLEIHINTRQAGIRGLVSLPYASGKKLRIIAFGKKADESGADIIGNEEKIEEITKGKIDFDLAVITPEWMPKLAKAARVLGPRGLMPNPKNGTITEDLKKAVESFQSGKTEYRSESKAMLIHLALGKLTQPSEELIANVKALLSTIGKSRIKKVTLAPTMGTSVKLDLSSI